MSEGAPPKTKRNGARTFKNPPQPHMCIKDQVLSSDLPCYVNVLSWDKVDMPASPNMPVPLFGGMQLTPPRTEDKSTLVFAVIANTEVLKMRGKNCKNPNELENLVVVLLDFVETMNNGIKFKRKYEILKDRDITGELKEVWITVQNQTEKEATVNQPETWIDVPQYPQCTDQQQQQQPSRPHPQQQMSSLEPLPQISQQQQQQQQQQPPHPQPQMSRPEPLQQISQHVQQQQQQQIQQIQHIQQNQQMMQNSYMMQQPPQYTHNEHYNPMSDKRQRFERCNYQQQNQMPVNQNDQAYQSLVRSYSNSFGRRIDSDRFHYREQCRTLPKPMPEQPPPPMQQPPQQNCPAYLTSHADLTSYLLQRYARLDSNMGPTYGNQMNPPINHYNDYIMMQHQHMTAGIEQRQIESQMHAESAHRMQQQHQQQQQEQQMLVPPPQLMQQPAPQYQPSTLSVIASHAAVGNDKRNYHKFSHVGRNGIVGGMPKNNLGKRQNNSPTHMKQGPPPQVITGGMAGLVQSKENIADNTMKSPVKVLQRGPLLQNKQVVSQSSPDKNLKSLEKNVDGKNEACNVQVTDLDEEDSRVKNFSEIVTEVAPKKTEALNYAAALKELKDLTDYSKDAKTLPSDNPTSSFSESHVQDVQEVKRNHHQKRRAVFNKGIMRRNSYFDNKNRVKEMRQHHEHQTNSNTNDRLHDKDSEDHVKGPQAAVEANPGTGWSAHVKQKPADSPKRAQSTVNSIIKSVFKIHQGNNSAGDDVGSGKKQKSNGQIKTNATTNEQEETNKGYTILKKSEATTMTMSSSSDEVVVNEIAQLSIQDCKDTTEINAVVS
ncbi:putative mediator of RNA polymerase II transcription subunit 26 isoform X2 [Copidosoma floridanum]|uniref:putative mediator of RNA polymerase II transcription subunit 26 isoform X2 n=1 Tax=Copidosoma floridanum TaxID=29053 RepID=UPI0006C9DFFF|nr:putative mediator of RNA polymerase II transcription subunit 26 isoform X2 [Copidosoma floridanum]